ncbi:MAG: mechanosensitive ion channel family protein [Candidatus Omnitrophica bacterium]|nr:mechanosensitive ion channel family protein [Candidatus Omnitrophota bacterium]
MSVEPYLEKVGGWVMTSGIKILIIAFLLMITLQMVRLVASSFAKAMKRPGADEDFQKRADTLKGIIQGTLSVVVIVVGLTMLLGELGIEIGPIIAAAGVLGLAVGFGAQKVVEDVIGGFFILLEDQIRVGDVVQIGDKGGLVEKVSLRMVVLRDLAGNVHFIRNGAVGVVTNMTKEYSRYVFDIGVAYRENVDDVIEVVKQVDAELRKDPVFGPDILEPIEILGLDKFGDSSVIIKARTKTKPIKQWAVGREFNRRLKKRFDEKDIEIPFPHVTIYAGKDKKGQSPALNIAQAR